MKRNCIQTIMALLSIASFCFSETIYVPADQPSIQAGIDAAVNSDVVVVSPGTYFENINFLGKAIVVKSSSGPDVTLIDGGCPTDPDFISVVTFMNGEGGDSVLEGFSLTNGKGTKINDKHYGGGIYCGNASPVINGNIIFGNWASHKGDGGGICCGGASPVITNNTIAKNWAYFGAGIVGFSASTPLISNNLIDSNTAQFDGGGILVNQSSPTIINNTISNNSGDFAGGVALHNSSPSVLANNMITGNQARVYGSGIYCYWSEATLINNTLVDNHVEDFGGGIACMGSPMTVTNCIFWGNASPQSPCEIYVSNSFIGACLTISYSVIHGGSSSVHLAGSCTLNWGLGMKDDDPLFVDEAHKDLHLTFKSPCRGWGNSLAVTEPYDIDGNPRIQGTVDIGADEFYPHLYCTGDFTPGGSIEGKIIGFVDTWPVALIIGSGIMDPPVQHSWGLFYIAAPWDVIPLAPIPSNGVLVIPEEVPALPAAPYTIPMQALIEDQLTQLFVLEIR
ncbi:MAG: right-handed parallel beta-helix repeat-containing protein [Planctomycetota bacterium]